MLTITPEEFMAVAARMATGHIPAGLGTEDEACTIARLNLALTGRLTDAIPPCMSEVIGLWARRIQDAMPDEMRNSPEWRHVIPWAAGSGRDHEKERLDIILDWMWGTVLPTLQPFADQHGFATEWQAMTTKRTRSAAAAAAKAANAAANDDAYAAANAAYAADAAWAVADAAWATAAAAKASNPAAYAAAAAARAAGAAYAAWATVDPIGLLRRLIAVTAPEIAKV